MQAKLAKLRRELLEPSKGGGGGGGEGAAKGMAAAAGTAGAAAAAAVKAAAAATAIESGMAAACVRAIDRKVGYGFCLGCGCGSADVYLLAAPYPLQLPVMSCPACLQLQQSASAAAVPAMNSLCAWERQSICYSSGSRVAKSEDVRVC
jgi:hypothetical protein